MAPPVARKDARTRRGRAARRCARRGRSAPAGAHRAAMKELRKKVTENADYVGDKFAEEARKIHYKETEPRGIYGEATRRGSQGARRGGHRVPAAAAVARGPATSMARIVITGANRGIGLALARGLRQARRRGDRRRAASPRRRSKALGAEVHDGVEVTDDASVAGLRRGARADVPIDVLINNAGIHRVDGLGRIDFDGIREQFEVNTLGPIRVTEALLPNLRRGAKVAIITSRSRLDRRQRLGRQLRLPHVEGGGEHGRRQSGARPEAARHRGRASCIPAWSRPTWVGAAGDRSRHFPPSA